LIALSARAKSASHGITLDVTLSILPVFWIYLCTFLYSRDQSFARGGSIVKFSPWLVYRTE
jgi:hypothetical protein